MAFAAILLVAGSGLVLAGPGAPAYVPKFSVLQGPDTVSPGGSATFSLQVTFTNGKVQTNPTGTTFAAVNGTISSTGSYTNTSGTKDKISGTFIDPNGVKTSASKIIFIQ